MQTWGLRFVGCDPDLTAKFTKMSKFCKLVADCENPARRPLAGRLLVGIKPDCVRTIVRPTSTRASVGRLPLSAQNITFIVLPWVLWADLGLFPPRKAILNATAVKLFTLPTMFA